MELFHLEHEQRREAERRLRLLGELVMTEYNYDLLRKRSKEVFVPLKPLWEWWHAQRDRGFEGLIPAHWQPLDEATQELVRQRLALLGEFADAVIVTSADITELAKRNNWSERTSTRWLLRHRVGGLWGLARGGDPEKMSSHRKMKPSVRALATLDAAAFNEIERRLHQLGELVKHNPPLPQDVEEQAKKVGVTERTLISYHQAYHEFGLPGLAPKQRSDKAQHHGITACMVEIIQGIRYKDPKLSIKAIHERACERAQYLGEPMPGVWQVRMICADIPKAELLLAEKREDEFRDSYAITVSMRAMKERSKLIIYEMDHTLVDALVKDNLRAPHLRTPSEEIRPWLTLCIEQRSRLVMAALFSYDRPDRHTVAAVIREAVLRTEEKPYGGVPNEIWVDRGKELLAGHIQQFTQELKIILHPCKPHYPQEKGTVERFFGTLNTRLWATLPGYVGSNTVERNPNAKAKYTLAELEAKFKAFVQQYHHEVHSQTGKTPLDYWMTHCWAESADYRQLDRLLKEVKEHKVLKVGIKHENRIYWHTALATLVGKYVRIRVAPTYAPPDEIEVYDGDQWVCTAFAMDSPAGLAITAHDVASAKEEQRTHVHKKINGAKRAVDEADSKIEALKKANSPEEASLPPPEPQEIAQPSPAEIPQEPSKDLLDRFGDENDR